MTNHEISTKQKAAIRALLTGATYADASKAARVNQNAITGWMRDPVFLAALHQAEGETMQAVTRQLVTLAGEAVTTLRDIMKDAEENASPRVRAADALLGRLLQVKELYELEARIAALEAAQNDDKQP